MSNSMKIKLGRPDNLTAKKALFHKKQRTKIERNANMIFYFTGFIINYPFGRG